MGHRFVPGADACLAGWVWLILPETVCLWAVEPRDLVYRDIKHLARRIRVRDGLITPSIVVVTEKAQRPTNHFGVDQSQCTVNGHKKAGDNCPGV